MSLRSIAARIAELEKSLTIIPKVARTIAHSLRSRLFGKTEELSSTPLAEYERPEVSKTVAPIGAGEPNLGDRDLPRTYGRTRLVMLVVDASTVHAYWEVTPDKLAQASKESMGSPGSPASVLRFYKSAAAGHSEGTPSADWFDVAVDLQSRNWYVHLWSPDRSYYAELGLKSDIGRFVPLARSNVVRTPRVWPVMHVQEHFMRVASLEPHAELVSPPAFVPPRSIQPSFPLKEVNPPAAESSVGTPPPSEIRPPARIDSEHIMKGKLAGLFAAQVAPFERSQGQEVSSVQGSDSSLTVVAEQHFVTGIFSHAPRNTADKK